MVATSTGINLAFAEIVFDLEVARSEVLLDTRDGDRLIRMTAAHHFARNLATDGRNFPFELTHARFTREPTHQETPG